MVPNSRLALFLVLLVAGPARATLVGWGASAPITSSGNAIETRVGDIDGDGDQDVVEVSQTGNSVSWRRNGGANWTVGSIVSGLSSATALDVGDLDNDGDLDAVSASFLASGVLDVFQNDGTGSTWTTRVVDGGAAWIADIDLTDVDTDGDLDVVAGGSGSVGLSWYENTAGDATLWLKHAVLNANNAYTVDSIDAGDLDNDGDIDLVAEDSTNGTVRICFAGDPSASTFSCPTTISAGGVIRLALGD